MLMAKWEDVAKESPKQTSDRIVRRMRDNARAAEDLALVFDASNRKGKKR